MDRFIYEFRCWLTSKNIPIEGLTVIFNWQDSQPAAAFDYVVQQEMERYTIQWGRPSSPLDIRKFELHGLRIRVESPIHELAVGR